MEDIPESPQENRLPNDPELRELLREGGKDVVGQVNEDRPFVLVALVDGKLHIVADHTSAWDLMEELDAGKHPRIKELSETRKARLEELFEAHILRIVFAGEVPTKAESESEGLRRFFADATFRQIEKE